VTKELPDESREPAFGVLRVADAPPIAHRRMVAALMRAVDAQLADEHQPRGELFLGPTDVVLDPDGAVVVQPDLVFVSRGRAAIVADRIHGAPDLIIEVVAAPAPIAALEERVGWYARYGVRECWLASLTERRYAILTLNSARGVVDRQLCEPGQPAVSSVLPGLLLPPFP
jgi:Uma2 family endonuclease